MIKVREIGSLDSVQLKILLALIGLAVLGYSIYQIAVYPKWIVDDAFINFRYAENLVEKGQLNWNVGEDPVEGYTGIGLVLLIALCLKIGISPVVAAHIIGITCYFVGAAVFLLLFKNRPILSFIGLSLYATMPFLFTHAWSGLETTLFTSSILLSLYSYHIKAKNLFIIVITILSLIRPEGLLLASLLILIFRPISWLRICLFAAVICGYLLIRWKYYGYLLPNTFYAKYDSLENVETINQLFKFIKGFLLVPAIILVVGVRFSRDKIDYKLLVAMTIFLVVSGAVYSSSNLVMNYAERFFVPFYIVVVGLVAILPKKMSFITILIMFILLTIQIVKNRNGYVRHKLSYYSSTHYGVLTDEHIRIGKYLQNNISNNEWLVVVSDAGAIPYYSKMNTIDCGELNDEYLAHSDYDSLEFRNYIYNHNPGVIVITSFKPNTISRNDKAKYLSGDQRFNEYLLAGRIKSRFRKDYYQFVYFRRELAEQLNIKEDSKIEPPKYDRGQLFEYRKSYKAPDYQPTA